MATINLREQQVSFFKTISENADQSTAAVSKIDWETEDLVAVEDFAKLVSSQLEKELAEAVASSLLTLCRISKRNKLKYSEVQSVVLKGLEEQGWQELDLANVRKFLDVAEKAVSGRRLRTLVKASDVYLATNHHIEVAKIFSLIKPVFNDGRDGVAGYIVTNQMRLIISDRLHKDDEYFIDFSTDQLAALRDEIDRALNKTNLLTEKFQKESDLPIVVYKD